MIVSGIVARSILFLSALSLIPTRLRIFQSTIRKCVLSFFSVNVSYLFVANNTLNCFQPISRVIIDITDQNGETIHQKKTEKISNSARYGTARPRRPINHQTEGLR